MRLIRPRVFLVVVGLATLAVPRSLRAAGGEWVVVSATAAPEYRRTKGPDGVLPESYVFSPGIHFGGAARDATQEKMPFLSIAKIFSAGLALMPVGISQGRNGQGAENERAFVRIWLEHTRPAFDGLTDRSLATAGAALGGDHAPRHLQEAFDQLLLLALA